MKQFVLTFCMIFVVLSHARTQGYVISGEVKEADGKTVSLKQYRNLQPVEVSSATVQAGKFTLKGNVSHPEFSMMYIDNKGPAQFFIENVNIRIVVDLENMEKSKVTGSKENEVFMEFMTGLEKFTQQQKKLQDSYIALSTSSVATPEAVTNIRKQMEQIETEYSAYMINFVQKNPGKITTAFLLSSVNGLMQLLNISQLEQLVNSYDAKTSQSQWMKMINDRVATDKRTAIGQPFLDITLKTPDDKPISISDYAGKGKYVLLDFWAAWCGPCRNANPRVVELYKRYKDKGFEIVGISLDQSKDAWVKAIRDDNLNWPHMSDLNYWNSAAAKLYSVSSIPHMVLLGKDGKIIAKGLHVESLSAKLAELLGN